MSFGARLRERREALGLKQSDLGALLGVTGSAIGNYENGISSPKADVLYQVFDVLKCDANYLFQDEMKELEVDDFTVPEIRMVKKYRALDVYGQDTVTAVLDCEHKRCIEQAAEKEEENQDNIIMLRHATQKASAGTGILLDEEHMEEWSVIYNDLTRRADFCVDVDGRSMEPKFHSGDTVLIREQPAVELGEIGLYIKEGMGYIKRQGHGIIESINPECEDISPTEFVDIKCMGKVIGVLDPDWVKT